MPLAYWGFDAGPDGLRRGGHAIADLADRHGTPFYAFDASRLAANARQALSTVRHHLPGTILSYSLKTNPYPRVLTILRQTGLGAEAISGREMNAALAAGFAPEQIIFNGPGKTDAELRAAAERGVRIQIESASEARALAGVAATIARPVRAGIRINPDVFDPRAPASVRMGSGATVFGLDPDGAEFAAALEALRAAPRLVLETLSAHVGTGIISVEPFRRTIRALLESRVRMRTAGLAIDTLDIGGGFAVPSEVRYGHGAFDALEAGQGADIPAPNEIASLADVCVAVAAELGDASRPTVVMEPGRLLVSDAFHLVTRVTRLKEERGVRFAILDAGRIQNALFVGRGFHEMIHARRPEDESRIAYTIVGPLCAAFDVFARDRLLPRLSEGDVLVICDVGAYNLSAQSQWSFDPAPVVALTEDAAAAGE